MPIHKINGVTVRTTNEFPPIPVRQFDWSAIDDDTYDGAEDSHCPIGRGATEQEAIDDLFDQMADAGTYVAVVEALEECAAPWSSGPGILNDCFNKMGDEFQRRINLAQKALRLLKSYDDASAALKVARAL